MKASFTTASTETFVSPGDSAGISNNASREAWNDIKDGWGGTSVTPGSGHGIQRRPHFK